MSFHKLFFIGNIIMDKVLLYTIEDVNHSKALLLLFCLLFFYLFLSVLYSVLSIAENNNHPVLSTGKP